MKFGTLVRTAGDE